MVSEMTGQLFFSIMTGVIGGLIVYYAEKIARKFDPKNERWWLVIIIALAILVIFATYLAYI